MKLTFILFLILFCYNLNAQVTDSLPIQKDSTTSIEKMPEYPGGVKALYEYFYTETRYPEEALKKGIEGTVYVKFVVDQEGFVINPVVMRGVGGGCDEEALRVVASMPQWIPGSINGENVSVWYTVPIKFNLISEKQKKKNKNKN